MQRGETQQAQLKAPFPWFGGKSRVAALVWQRFGVVKNYVEPFAGSLAVLLGRPTPPRTETVNDLDCFIANFWRALAADPEGVAAWADSPVNEADLHARHEWLHDQAEFIEAMHTDPDHYNVKVAGWWVWGLSAWIGDNWCRVTRQGGLPHLAHGGQGVHRTGLTQQLPDLSGAAVDALPGRPADQGRSGWSGTLGILGPGRRDAGPLRLHGGVGSSSAAGAGVLRGLEPGVGPLADGAYRVDGGLSRSPVWGRGSGQMLQPRLAWSIGRGAGMGDRAQWRGTPSHCALRVRGRTRDAG